MVLERGGCCPALERFMLTSRVPYLLVILNNYIIHRWPYQNNHKLQPSFLYLTTMPHLDILLIVPLIHHFLLLTHTFLLLSNQLNYDTLLLLQLLKLLLYILLHILQCLILLLFVSQTSLLPSKSLHQSNQLTLFFIRL